MLSEEKSELIGGLYVTNKEACSGTRNYDCTNKDNCYKSDNSWNCSNSGNCEGSNNHNTCTGGGSGGTGGGSGANRMAMLGFPGLDL